ncbi:MAG: hypothetical protein GWM98_07600 [Nitrospinaceae bacterium]|nr:hypothetical protein [Nitrospinaceae bacterium]NIR54389.1 hypothetical protein [Nitrospinaceae bacterium]NIS84802.1 hypothetical protein [Nitrospinaceae bacterium]NIT81608.1 hypothetical protein [Nitrospinaceae bacterium]NIU43890.1 hypothetical protein [Nitrospinaceae bacterium]
MDNDPPKEPQVEETLILLKKIWVLFLIGLYAACIYNEYIFPGLREEPLKGEEVLINVQRVLFFALMALGVLTDIVQIRIDQKKAFMFLFLSLILGGLCNLMAIAQVGLMRMLSGG